MHSDSNTERFETVIIGGGQAGLAVGQQLATRGRPFVILDGSERIGDAWRKRWDSLRLFTPARYNGLPGMPFPAPGWTFPTKDAMADYLESYAARFEMPVRSGVRVDGLSREMDAYVVTSGGGKFLADHVVVATGAHHEPKLPSFASELKADVVQLHSSAYRGPGQLREGGVLIVGAGNSGAEIAKELCTHHKVWLSGPRVGEIPVRHGSLGSRFFLPVIRFAGTHVLTADTPMGRKLAPKFISGAAPLIRVKSRDLVAAGVERVPRVVGVRDGRPLLANDRMLDIANVVWCTGSRQTFDWIHLPVFGEDGRPVQYRGVVASAPGLYFVGLAFQYAATSDVLPGVSRDAQRVAQHIAARVPDGRLSAFAAGSKTPAPAGRGPLHLGRTARR